MEHLARPSPALANRRRKPPTGKGEMTPLGELVRNPVSLTVIDGPLTHLISAERGPSGKVWLTCQCPAATSAGWCKHRVDLLCFRFDRLSNADAISRRAFAQIVAGTAVCDAGRAADRALKAFDECLRIFDERRPAEIVAGNLRRFTDLASDLAACAGELEDALGTLQRLFERN